MSLSVFSEAREFINSVVSGETDPAVVQSLLEKARARKNSRTPEPKLCARANPTVRRNSGLFVPARYSEAVRDRKPIMVGLWSGMSELSVDDYERQELCNGSVSFTCRLADWGLVTGYALFVGEVGQHFPAQPAKHVRTSDTLKLSIPSTVHPTRT